MTGYNGENFNFDGSVKTEHYILTKEGFQPIRLRKFFGKWEMLMHRYINGDERWAELTSFSEDIILDHIEKYGRKLY